jgi:hypothetical protein
MSATIVARSESSFTVQVEIPYGSSMLDFEQTIQERLNQAGVVATQEALQQFDTDGSSITVGSVTSSPARANSPRTTRPPMVSPPSPDTSTKAPRGVRPTARWTGTPALSSVPPPASPR